MTLVLWLIMNDGFSFDSSITCSELLRVSWVNLGYIAGWSPSELETEIRSGTWAKRIYLERLLSSCRAPLTPSATARSTSTRSACTAVPTGSPVRGLSLYKIFFHFKALLWESIILLLPPPSPAKPALLQYCCTTIAQYTPPHRLPSLDYIYHLISAMAISCKGQSRIREGGGWGGWMHRATRLSLTPDR